MPASIVLMPEATVHKNDLTPAGKGDIGSARRGFPLCSKPITEPVKQSPDRPLGLGIGAADTAHNFATRERRGLSGNHCLYMGDGLVESTRAPPPWGEAMISKRKRIDPSPISLVP